MDRIQLRGRSAALDRTLCLLSIPVTYMSLLSIHFDHPYRQRDAFLQSRAMLLQRAAPQLSSPMRRFRSSGLRCRPCGCGSAVVAPPAATATPCSPAAETVAAAAAAFPSGWLDKNSSTSFCCARPSARAASIFFFAAAPSLSLATSDAAFSSFPIMRSESSTMPTNRSATCAAKQEYMCL